MADTPHTTPPTSSRNDRELAVAYRGLEDAVAGLKNMAMLMEMAVEGTLENPLGGAAEEIARLVPWTATMRVLVLSEDQADGLEYALGHIGTLIRDLHRTYNAAFVSRAA
ncbi:hypothetical protein FPV16_25535 [Methylobacterium sp. W2]|uniref:hypothetical protein n=1 Tax=Methylobacterium sp. W2 TaxID=2598107 RepID=UPI001D0C93FE|nr:hypothetical protein [Methylobacterium sp. W2]MCC0809521.1 hypothetical protein [Methylobacterium sp. W2]